jgi:hypothetical protein
MAKTTSKSTKTQKLQKSPKTKKIPHLYKERHPEKHTITGKYTFFLVLFSITTFTFALLSIYLYYFAEDLLKKYDSIDTSLRNATHIETETIIDIDSSEAE